MGIFLGAIKDKRKYRIRTKDGRIKYAGTGEDSWFTLSEARDKVNYKAGEAIYEHDGVRFLWEIL